MSGTDRSSGSGKVTWLRFSLFQRTYPVTVLSALLLIIASIAAIASCATGPNFFTRHLSSRARLRSAVRARGSPSCPKAKAQKNRTSGDLSRKALISIGTLPASAISPRDSAAIARTRDRSRVSANTEVSACCALVSPILPNAYAQDARTSASVSRSAFSKARVAVLLPTSPNARAAALRILEDGATSKLERACTALLLSMPRTRGTIQHAISTIPSSAVRLRRTRRRERTERTPAASSELVSERTRAAAAASAPSTMRRSSRANEVRWSRFIGCNHTGSASRSTHARPSAWHLVSLHDKLTLETSRRRRR